MAELLMRNEEPDAEALIPEVVAETPSALEAQARAEIDRQIATAKAYPRSLKKFMQRAKDMVLNDVQTAEESIYMLERSGKCIEGPSVRLAEIILHAWGNVRCEARIIADDGKYLVAQGVAIDLENNVAVSVEVRRRITDRRGNRYSDDMIGVTANAACAIAYRNAGLKLVPRVYTNQIYQAAKELITGGSEPLDVRREKMLKHFQRFGINQDQILAKLNVESVDQIGMDEIVKLLGISNAIRDGDSSIDEEFPTKQQAKDHVGGSSLEQNGPSNSAEKERVATQVAPPPQNDVTGPENDKSGEVPLLQQVKDKLKEAKITQKAAAEYLLKIAWLTGADQTLDSLAEDRLQRILDGFDNFKKAIKK